MSTVDGQLSVVVADDAALMREAFAALLDRGGFRVAAQVGDAEELHRAVAEVRPDLVVVDVRMPPEHRVEGLRAAVRIRGEHPGTGVLVLSAHIETHYLPALLSGGARGVGYLLKERVAGIDAFLDAARRVAGGAASSIRGWSTGCSAGSGAPRSWTSSATGSGRSSRSWRRAGPTRPSAASWC
ncbi:response regulator transcription factor [Actinokineospora soli]|uniref:Response regulator transcription factor n=1 Tax=Actinokineospora soli TaxID=1048753 RepID=A0ABW2TLU2_9PSEU